VSGEGSQSAGQPGQPSGAQPPGGQLGRLRTFHPGWYGAVMGTAIVGIVSSWR
jgi:hypothetical protein